MSIHKVTKQWLNHSKSICLRTSFCIVKIQYVAVCNCVRDFWGRTAIFWVFVWAAVGTDSVSLRHVWHFKFICILFVII